MNLLDVVIKNKEDEIYKKIDSPEMFYKMEKARLKYSFTPKGKFDISSLKFNDLKHIKVEIYKEPLNPFKRAKIGEMYYFITSRFKIAKESESNSMTDDRNYENGNYFNSKEVAEEAEELLRKTLKEFKEKKLKKL